MGKKFFSRGKKDMTDEQIQDVLSANCVPTKASTSRTSKFSAYNDYAQQVASSQGRRVPGPNSNPYANPAVPGALPGAAPGAPTQAPSGSPYGGPSTSNPYAAAAAIGYNPQQSSSSSSANNAYLSPYANPSSQYNNNGHSNGNSRSTSPAPSYRTVDNNATSSPYSQAASQYGNRFGSQSGPSSDPALEAQKNQLFAGAKVPSQQQQQQPPSQQQQQPSGSAMSAPNRAALFGAAVSQPSQQPPNQNSPYSAAFNDNAAQESAQARFKNKRPDEYTAEEELLYMTTTQGQGSRRPSANGQGNGTQAMSFDDDGHGEDVNSEDEDVEGIKTQMKFIKRDDVQLTRSALRSAAYADESSRNTLGMLGSQGEILNNVERSLELASTQNRIASEKTRELKTLNRSMFAPHVANPFNSKRRAQEKEEQIKAERLRQQVARETLRSNEYDSQQRIMNGMGADKFGPPAGGAGGSATAQKYKRNYRERSKYQFEADSEDEALEDEIDGNLDAIYQAAKNLHKKAIVTNEEIVRQNEQIARIAENVDSLDIGVHLNSNRLMNIK